MTPSRKSSLTDRKWTHGLWGYSSALILALSCTEIAPPIPIKTPDPDTQAVHKAALDTNDPEDAPEREIVGSGYW